VSEAHDGTIRYRVDRLERDHVNVTSEVRELNQKIDRLILVFVTGSISVTVAIIAATIALLTGGGAG
jgi:hypothetical protein